MTENPGFGNLDPNQRRAIRVITTQHPELSLMNRDAALMVFVAAATLCPMTLKTVIERSGLALSVKEKGH